MKLPRASQILTRPFYLFCTFALAASFFLPTTGLGISLCGFYRTTHLPCFGCGLTRAVTNVSHFNLQEAWQYHPFGLFLWPVMVFFALVGIRKQWSQKIHRTIERHNGTITPVFWTCLALFFAFGIWRMCFAGSWIGHDHPSSF